MSRKQVNLHIGTLDDMGERFIAAWKTAETGTKIARDKKYNVTFLSLESFLSVMSPKRLELLKRLRQLGPSSVRALAAEVARDYKTVHGDVDLLHRAGLIERLKDGRVEVVWDRVKAEMKLAS